VAGLLLESHMDRFGCLSYYEKIEVA
jgi:hypothetical protein